MTNKISWWRKLLIKLGIIKQIEINKKEMCLEAQAFCNRNCTNCIWGGDTDVDKQEEAKSDDG